MNSKRIRIAVPVLALIILIAPLVVPNVFGLGYSLKPTPARVIETSVNSATAVDLILNVSQASIGTTYQFTWVVTDPSGNSKNHQNQTVATSSSFILSLEYPRDFGTNMILAGNYTVAINQNMPAGATNPVQTGQFQIGLTDKVVYQRTNTVLVNAAGYANGESVTMNITRGSATYTSSLTASSAGQVSGSWQVPISAAVGAWKVLLKGTTTNKPAPDQQTFTVVPTNVTLSPLTTIPATVQRTNNESISFSANYLSGGSVQIGSAKVRFTEPSGVTSFYRTATYNSSLNAFQTVYSIPANVPIGGWTVAVDTDMFNDSYGNLGPAASVVQSFTVSPTNVTVSPISLGHLNLQRTQTQTITFSVNYLNGMRVTTGSANIRLIETDGTTTLMTTASYNSTVGAFQATSKIPASSEAGAWVASVDPDSFNDGYGNGGPASSVVRAFTVSHANLTVTVTIASQTYTVGQVIPIYAKITYPDGSLLTTGNVTAILSTTSVQIGTTTLTFVPGQSEWVGTYTVRSNDPSGVLLVTMKVSDSSGNSGQETVSAIVSVPPSTPSQPLDLYYFLFAALAIGSGGSGVILLRRINPTHRGFDEFFKLTGGELSPGTTLLILGDPGSGTSTLSLELVHRQLALGRPCGLLTYDAFPSEVLRSMRGFGWDPSENVNDGTFKILDCYSALAGVENAPIRDPVDFTEISIQVTRMIENASSKPFTLVLDSIAPIFNSAPARTAINFLRVLSAKIKNTDGILILAGAKASIPEEARSNLETIGDGVVELGNLRSGQSMVRTLTVKRIAGREISPEPAEFDIVPGKGMLFKKLRIPLRIITPKRKTGT